MSPEITVLLTAMIPLTDVKVAIPLGIKLGLSSTTSFLFAVTGNIIPAALTLALIGPVTDFLCKHSKFCNKFFTNLFNKTRKEHSKKFQRYGAIFLVTFVALPIPGSGSAAGALIAFLFGINFWKALPLISLGIVLASAFITAGFTSIFAIMDLLA
ncbi:small multi-drug export protein [Candidatus Peregrinibacteria bacterium]|nr:small multi-drug export protein [Candidatus Peregrinibacteria bacterium]